MRKEADFNVTDKISITIKGSQTVTSIAKAYEKEIAGDTLAVSITVGEPQGFIKEWDINGEAVVMGVKQEGSI